MDDKSQRQGAPDRLSYDPRELERVATSFRGLAHPTRLQILLALGQDGAMSPAQLVRLVTPRMALGSVSHHTRELLALGLIDAAGTQPVRGALQHFYRLSLQGRALMEIVDRLLR